MWPLRLVDWKNIQEENRLWAVWFGQSRNWVSFSLLYILRWFKNINVPWNSLTKPWNILVRRWSKIEMAVKFKLANFASSLEKKAWLTIYLACTLISPVLYSKCFCQWFMKWSCRQWRSEYLVVKVDQVGFICLCFIVHCLKLYMQHSCWGLFEFMISCKWLWAYL